MLINPPDFSKAQKRDKVWSIIYGPGEITEIWDHLVYPIIVEFEIEATVSYTKLGFASTNHFEPTLFPSEPIILGPPEGEIEETIKRCIAISPEGDETYYRQIQHIKHWETVLGETIIPLTGTRKIKRKYKAVEGWGIPAWLDQSKESPGSSFIKLVGFMPKENP